MLEINQDFIASRVYEILGIRESFTAVELRQQYKEC